MSVVSGVVSAISGNKSANTQAAAATQAASTSAAATKIAADASASAQKYSTDVAERMYNQTRTDQEPWRKAGVNALAKLGSDPSLITPYPDQKKFTLADFEADPGYNFRLSEGIKALDRSASSRGGLFSGAQGKDLVRYGQNVGSAEYAGAYERYQNEYQNAFNRYQTNQSNQYNRLASMAGLGQTANNALQTAGSNYANSAGNYAMAGAGNTGNLLMLNAANTGNAQLMAGQARASAYQGYGQAASGASKAAGNYLASNYNDLNTYAGQANAWLQNAWL